MTSAARRATDWSRVLVLLLCVLPVAMLGCFKQASGNSAGYYPEAPADYEQSYGTGGDDGSYDYRGDVAEGAMAGSPAPPSRQTIGKQREEKERSGKDMFKNVPEEPAPDMATDATVQPEPLEAPTDTPKQPAPVAQKRQIIYTATMQVSVYDLEHSLEIVEGLPERYGGWLHQRVDNQIVLRVPAERLAEVMATVAELGVVDYRLLEALDVTAEYTDLESRILILVEMQKQLQALLVKATSVEQALEIRRALDQITLELEAARAQMRELSKSIAFSTLILSLVERGPTQLVPSSNDPFRWVDELGVEVTDYR
jgi:chemotaxis protein histidine kinase CheA